MSRRNKASAAPELSLAEKLAVLLEHGAARGLTTTYPAIAEATRQTVNSIRKVCLGENTNPRLSTIRALADYFGVRLNYFNCITGDDCQKYLAGGRPPLPRDLALRVDGLSEESLQTLIKVMDAARKAENLLPLGPD